MEPYVSMQNVKYSNGPDDMFSALSSDRARLVNLLHIATII
jgi:hypothetical protein